MMKKIEEQELKELNDIQFDIQNIISNLGEIEYKIFILNQEKENILSQLKIIQNKEKNLKDSLIKKYGDNINIDLKTGEIN